MSGSEATLKKLATLLQGSRNEATVMFEYSYRFVLSTYASFVRTYSMYCVFNYDCVVLYVCTVSLHVICVDECRCTFACKL